MPTSSPRPVAAAVRSPADRPPRRADAPTGLASEAGFTLIELLVVILIIGILAAIALPNFLSQRDRAHDISAISNIRNGTTYVEACFVETGNYGNCGTAATDNTGLSTGWAPDGVTVGVIFNIDGAYTIWSKSKSGTTFRSNRDVWGTYVKTCDKPGNGRCKSDGTW